MGTVFFAICFFLVVKTSGDYLAKEIIINRPTLRDMNDGAQVDGILQAAGGSRDFECGEFNAVSPSGVIMNRSIHECECTSEARHLAFLKSSGNVSITKHFAIGEDCGFRFSLESEDDPLRILTEGDEKDIILPSENCSINATTSMYLECGSWLPIDEISVLNKFSLHQLSMDCHILKVHSENISSFLNGHVVKLGLTCHPSDGEPCLMFKLKGSVKFFAKESIGMNHTSVDGNQNAMTEKRAIVLTAVIPGIIAGGIIILISVLLLCLARRMGHQLIRVGAGRDENAEDGVPSFSEDATIHGSEENLSVYELVERGNPSGVNEHQASVSNPVYRKDDHIVFQGASNNITTPDDADNIYAEPFGHINGTNVHSTDLTPLDSTTGYQDLLAKNPDTAEYASRYSVPQSSSQARLHEGSDQATRNGPNTCTSGASSSTGESPPNMERKERYALREIVVEDLDIETSEAPEDLFEEMRLRPSFLRVDTAISQSKDCDKITENISKKENLCSTTKLSEGRPTQKRQIEPLERHPCTGHEVSTRNKSKSLERLKTFFKLTL
ncbi:hypothetical protein OS493_035961 [Desmophyllum pertusum]|uniref:Uncharacterized protein n=1 Tax=Desmophyllum pertusum TaxID=174260 RepID=A0A9W9YI69_9CNID|nr:hypothetical protein OS493_035961 [Desmophyllum pertusum]